MGLRAGMGMGANATNMYIPHTDSTVETRSIQTRLTSPSILSHLESPSPTSLFSHSRSPIQLTVAAAVADMKARETSVTAILVDFIKVLVHSILYYRNVYPAEIFFKARRYYASDWRSPMFISIAILTSPLSLLVMSCPSHSAIDACISLKTPRAESIHTENDRIAGTID